MSKVDRKYYTPQFNRVDPENYILVLDGTFTERFLDSLAEANRFFDEANISEVDRREICSCFEHANFGIQVLSSEDLETKLKGLLDNPIDTHFVCVEKHLTKPILSLMNKITTPTTFLVGKVR